MLKKHFRNLAICSLFFAFSNQISFAQVFKKSRFDLKVSIASMYDDNILKYSDKYINRFLNNEDEGRFEIKTYDDVYVKSKISTSYYFKFFKKKKTKISATFSNSSYIKNSVKTWNYYGIGIQQSFAKKASVKFAYSYIPAFYVRQFRQYDLVELYGYEPITFKPYVFAKDNYKLVFKNTFFKKTKVNVAFNKAKYYHNSYYTEYDSENLSAGLQVEQRLSKKIRIVVGYVYTDSDAKGFDEVGETKETADESDGSYQDDTFVAEIKATLPKVFKKKNTVSLKGKYSKRYFSSAHLIHNDPLHVGRIDKNIRVYFTYTIKTSKKTNFSLYYNNLFRDSYNNKGIYDAIVSEDKDYVQNQFGVQISYAIF